MGFLIYVIILFSAFSAQALILGELTGQGELSSTQTLGSQKNQYSGNPCQMAFNIRDTPEKYGVDFSAVFCNGMDIWNDVEQIVTVRGQELFSQDKKVGSLIDGVGTFTFSKTTSAQIEKRRYGFNCKAYYVAVENVELKSSLSYKIQKLGEGHYYITRTQQDDFVKAVVTRDKLKCPAYLADVVGQRTTELKGEVRK